MTSITEALSIEADPSIPKKPPRAPRLPGSRRKRQAKKAAPARGAKGQVDLNGEVSYTGPSFTELVLDRAVNVIRALGRAATVDEVSRSAEKMGLAEKTKQPLRQAVGIILSQNAAGKSGRVRVTKGPGKGTYQLASGEEIKG